MKVRNNMKRYVVDIMLHPPISVVSVLRHEEVVTFSRDVDATHQRVSCISLSIDEDMVYSPGREYLLQFEVVESTDRFDGPSQVIIKIRENGEDIVSILFVLVKLSFDMLDRIRLVVACVIMCNTIVT